MKNNCSQAVIELPFPCNSGLHTDGADKCKNSLETCKCKDIRIVILRKDDHPLYLCSIPTTTLSLPKNGLDNNQQNYIIINVGVYGPKATSSRTPSQPLVNG